MGRYLIPVLIGTFFLLSCRKGEGSNAQNNDNHYFSFKVNGRETVYSGSFLPQRPPRGGVFAEKAFLSGFHELRIQGVSSATGGPTIRDEVYMNFVLDSVVNGENYLLQEINVGGFRVRINNKSFLTMPLSTGSPYGVNVTITKHAEGWISGTFSGKIRADQFNGNEELLITDGSFSSTIYYH